MIKILKIDVLEIIETREFTKTKLKELGFKVTDSYANFVFARHPEIDGKELFLALRKKGIIVRHWNKRKNRSIFTYFNWNNGTNENHVGIFK